MSKKSVAANFPSFKRPQSKTEEFVAYLQSLGYELPKNEKPEHYEYLFNDKELFEAVKALRRNIGVGNVIGEDEAKEFQKLLDQGIPILTGRDLEEALRADKKVKNAALQKSELLAQRKADLRRQIAEEKAKNAELEKLSHQIDVAIAMKKKSKTLESYRNENFSKNIDYYNEQILHGKKAVDSNLEKLCEILDSIMEAFSVIQEAESSVFFFKQDWGEIICREEQLFQSVRQIASSYGTGLMSHAAAAEDTPPIDPLQADEMARVIRAKVHDINRLKYLIIDEKVKKLELEGEAFKTKRLVEKWKDIVKEEQLTLADSGSVQTKRIAGIEQRISLLEIHLKDLKARKIDKLYNTCIESTNREIQKLQDTKEIAKARVNEFLDFINQILLSQSARLDISAFFVKLETAKIKDVLNKLKNYAGDLHSLNESKILMADTLPLAPVPDPELKSLLKSVQLQQLPPSYESTGKVVSKLMEKEQDEIAHSNAVHFQVASSRMIRVNDESKELGDQWKFLKSKLVNENRDDEIHELKNRYASAEAELLEDPEIIEARIKNSIAHRRSILGMTKQFLD